MQISQTGFRKEMGTMDSIYTLNCVANRQINKKGGKLIALFIDLKAAFRGYEDTNRNDEEKEIRESLIRRVEEILRETKNRVRVGRELGKSF